MMERLVRCTLSRPPLMMGSHFDTPSTGGRYDRISGMGHDTAHMIRICPATMIFIPRRDGLNYNQAEYAEPGDIVAGANVLAYTIMAADEHCDPA
nr:M20/M25/M40 family metallo-hydrolase [Komagataeibacter europaeus]